MKTSDYIELGSAGLMAIGIFGVLIHHFKNEKQLAARDIQFVAVILIIPAIVILALEKILTSETTATLFGAITGYLLSGIGDYKPQSSAKKPETLENDAKKPEKTEKI